MTAKKQMFKVDGVLKSFLFSVIAVFHLNIHSPPTPLSHATHGKEVAAIRVFEMAGIF